jgi:multiple sugar transport system permease protein/sn-glycerol 3-phosphate transport system permease protein
MASRLAGLTRVQGVGGRVPPATVLLVYAALALTAAAVTIPFLWMLSTSLKPLSEVFRFDHPLPSELHLENYSQAWNRAPFGRYLFNSAFTAIAILTCQFATIIPAAYGFARLRFPGRDVLFLLVLATMMVPVQVTFIPTFVLVSTFGWKDTYFALIVPFATSGFGIFLLRQAFLQVAQDFLDAARLDGCSHLGIMRHVMVPQNVPTLVTFGLFSFVAHYNDLFWPLVATESERMRTITLGVRGFIDMEGTTRWNEVMAACVFSMLPLIVLFLCTQRFFIRGVASSGLKG